MLRGGIREPKKVPSLARRSSLWGEAMSKSIPKSLCPVGPWVYRCATGGLWFDAPDWARHIRSARRLAAPNVHAAASVVITGGYAPHGWLLPFASELVTSAQTAPRDTRAVHDSGCKILLQITTPDATPTTPRSAPRRSRRRSPFRHRNTIGRVQRPSRDFTRCWLARVPASTAASKSMGSGYLLNQFLAPRTRQAHRLRAFTGQPSYRFTVEIIRHRIAVGPDSSSVTGCQWPTTLQKARVGISRWQPKWKGDNHHQLRLRLARGPGATIVTSVPGGAFVDISSAVAEHVTIPVVASTGSTCRRPARNGFWPKPGAAAINGPADGRADGHGICSVQSIRSTEINTCISCNQPAWTTHLPGKRCRVCAQSTRAGRETAAGAVPRPNAPARWPVVKGLDNQAGHGGQRRAARVTGSRCSRPATLSVDSTLAAKRIQRNHPVFLDDSGQTRCQCDWALRVAAQEVDRLTRSSWPPAWHRAFRPSPASTTPWC